MQKEYLEEQTINSSYLAYLEWAFGIVNYLLDQVCRNKILLHHHRVFSFDQNLNFVIHHFKLQMSLFKANFECNYPLIGHKA